MVSGTNGPVGLLVQNLVVVASAQGNESVIILHPPMVVQTVEETQPIRIIVIHTIVPVRR